MSSFCQKSNQKSSWIDMCIQPLDVNKCSHSMDWSCGWVGVSRRCSCSLLVHNHLHAQFVLLGVPMHLQAPWAPSGNLFP